MSRFRNRFLTCGLVLLVAYGARALGQIGSPVSGLVVDYFAPPPIVRGLVRDFSRSPDSPTSQMRAALRSSLAPLEGVGASGVPYVAGKLIVKFRDGASSAARLSTLSATSAQTSTRPSYANFDIVTIDPGEDAEAAARALAGRPDVEYAQAAYRFHTRFKPDDRFYPMQWNLPDIDMERAWDIQPAAGASIIVAVVDTGIAYTNVTMRYRANAFTMGGMDYPALGDLTLPVVAATELGPSSRFVSPHDFIWDTNVPIDLDGHGTHVSGTIGQLTNNGATGTGDVTNRGGTAGVAFNVKLMPVKVIDGDWDDIFGAPHIGTDDVVARGVRYAVDNGANVINMSIGRSGAPAPAVEDAIRYAVCSGAPSSTCSGKGAFIAIAGGNGFENGNQTEVIAEIANRVQGAVSVAATDQAHNRAYYSNTAPWIELAAPGGSFRGFANEGGILQQTLDLSLVETFTSQPANFVAPHFDALAYYYFIGTSQATAHVSGVAAFLMQQGITDPAAIEAALEKFATDRGSSGRDNEFGFGEINARNALRGLGLAR